MIFGVTGHRDVEQEPGELIEFARITVSRMVEQGCTGIISGMARGWDLAVALAAYEQDIPYTAAVPFPGQPSRWSAADKELYDKCMFGASRIEVISMLALTVSYDKRDRWIVDNCEELWALRSGRSSGTELTCLYAERQGRKVVPLWEDWIAFRAERNHHASSSASCARQATRGRSGDSCTDL